MSRALRTALGPRKVSFVWEYDTTGGESGLGIGHYEIRGVKTVEEWRLVMREIANMARSSEHLSDELIQQALDAP